MVSILIHETLHFMSEPGPALPIIPALIDQRDGDLSIPSSFSRQLQTLRRHLHQHPETGFEEHDTQAHVRALLIEHGLDGVKSIAKTGLYLDIQGDRQGDLVAYRADIDALPIQDAKSVPYASTRQGVAHLCGHDAHTAIAFGVALILHANRDRLRGAVRVFFQPNEEGMPGGATQMIDDGVMEGVQAVYAVHVDPSLELGKYGLLAGPITASTDQFKIVVRADSTGHSARPHEAVDTIWIATQIATTLYQLAGRVSDARNPSVLTICRFHAGDAYNVIPSAVEFGGTFRTTEQSDRYEMLSRIETIAQTISKMHGARAEVDLVYGSPPVDNDPLLVTHVSSVIRSTFGDQAIYQVPRPSMGGEDFAHYLLHAPGMLLRVGTQSGPETAYPLHDAHFDLDEAALAPTSLLMARVLAEHLEKRPLETL